jgi:methylglutaconyl-CoA hydratase
MAETKAWILKFASGGFDRSTFETIAQSHGATRRTPEAAEGLASFAEKRAARWEVSDPPGLTP